MIDTKTLPRFVGRKNGPYVDFIADETFVKEVGFHCGATCSGPLYRCTRTAGHEGPHIAHVYDLYDGKLYVAAIYD